MLKTHLDGIAALENPLRFGTGKEANQQSFKRDAAAQSGNVGTLVVRHLIQPIFQRSPERVGRAISLELGHLRGFYSLGGFYSRSKSLAY
jgi:hypothetical protein